jgi:hypothetical protein
MFTESCKESGGTPHGWKRLASLEFLFQPEIGVQTCKRKLSMDLRSELKPFMLALAYT